jgi:hypothetical protein
MNLAVAGIAVIGKQMQWLNAPFAVIQGREN